MTHGKSRPGLVSPPNVDQAGPGATAEKNVARAPAAVHEAIDLLYGAFRDLAPTATIAAATPPRYYSRQAWTDDGGEAQTFDDAVRELRKFGRVFKPGRVLLILRQDLHAFVERHAATVEPRKGPKPRAARIDVGISGPIDFEAVRNARRGSR